MSHTSSAPKTVYLKDYQPPLFWIDTVDLSFKLAPEDTVVSSSFTVRKNGQHKEALSLSGGARVKLLDVAIDGESLTKDDYQLSDTHLVIPVERDTFSLMIKTEINPKENLSLQGLYLSGGNFFTQCEAQGFRHITYFLDRPDVMSQYRVEIYADKSLYPVLLSNGNCIETEEFEDGFHRAVWEDPFPKPCYLFALVAGDLDCLEDEFVTRSERKVALKIYARSPDIEKCHHAMESLKKAMVWDETRFGLEYDLDIYNIVAVSDFNMGAMENKSLNIFNTKYVLASQETATDTDFDAIESVIGHEYFHNWTGNRVTCRDWFQLSLKEGLTVFRDQEFSSDLGSRGLKRIDDVRVLRAYQFPEDDGPMAHPIRPDHYIEINNFYTTTVYNKGAEVIRMMHTLLGEERFMAGMRLYFERHDGQAVTCDDFVAAMEDASHIDLGQFRRWYQQAGTPKLSITDHYDAETLRYEIKVEQQIAPNDAENPEPLHIPLLVSLYDEQGAPLELLAPNKYSEVNQYLLQVKENFQTFVFDHVATKPVISLLNKFSAPVKMSYDFNPSHNRFLLQHDMDSFSKWEAGQRLSIDTILSGIDHYNLGENNINCDDLVASFASLIETVESTDDRALLAELMTLPSEIYLGQLMDTLDVDALHTTRECVLETLAKELYERWWEIYERCNNSNNFSLSAQDKANRKLKNLALAYLIKGQSSEAYSLCYDQFLKADNMTDKMAALVTTVSSDSPMRDKIIADFYTEYEHDELVIDKWFSAQAVSQRKGMLSDIKSLAQHPAYSLKNPNRMRSLVGAFSMGNQYYFHHRSGEGYAFLADTVISLDQFNPQIAARMVGPLSRWKNLDIDRQALMKEQLNRILSSDKLSKDVYEIVSKSLK